MGHHHSIDRRTFVLGAGAALLGAAAGLGAFPQSARGAIGRYIVTSGPLRVRGWPGLSAPVVATLPQGTIVDVLAWDGAVDGHEWADVNVVGWALSGHVATAFIAPYATGDYPSGSTVYVTVDRLNLRRGPGTGYAIIGTVTYGTALVIAGEPSGGGGRIWFPVRYQSGEIIWVAGDYLTANVIAPEPSGGDFAVGDRVAVDVDAVNFRTAAGTSAGVIMVLSRGHCLEINGGPVIASG